MEQLDALFSPRLTQALVASGSGATSLAQRLQSCHPGDACREPRTVPTKDEGFNDSFSPAPGFDLADYFDPPLEPTTKPAKPMPKPFPRPGKPGTARLPSPRGVHVCSSSGLQAGENSPRGNREPSRPREGDRGLTDELRQVLVTTSSCSATAVVVEPAEEMLQALADVPGGSPPAFSHPPSLPRGPGAPCMSHIGGLR